jgi:PAP2 superfamily
MTPSSTPADWAAGNLRRFAWMLVGVTTLFAATEAVALAGVSGHLQPLSVHDITSNILFAIGFGSPLVLHLSSLPGWRETGRTLGLGAGLTALILVPWALRRDGFMGSLTDADRELIACHAVIGLGLASILVLGVRAWRGTGTSRTLPLIYLLPALVALMFTFVAGLYMNFTAKYFPTPADHLAYAADAAHGFQPSFATGRLFAAAPLLKVVCHAIYVAPSPALVFVYTFQVRAKKPPPVDVVTELLVLVLVGYAFYFFFPVCGPGFAFGDAFPDRPPPVEDVLAHPPQVPDRWRNGMPSLHLATVLLAYWLARPYGMWVRVVAAVFVAGNVLATMGLGEHYFVDLVVALPFTLMVHAALTPVDWGARNAALFGSAALVCLWYFLLFGVFPAHYRDSPFFAWVITIGTTVTVVRLERNLYRATAGAAP